MAAKLFLGGISPNTSGEGIEAHFSKYGTVIDSVVMYKDGKHRGFGFVTFDNEESMRFALSEEQNLDGRVIDVKQAVGKDQAPPARAPMGGMGGGMGCGMGGGMGMKGGMPPSAQGGPLCDKVFVGGLAQTTTDDMVKEYFSQYGNIIDVVVMKDRESQRSRGFGFVQYDDTAPVEQVMADYAQHQIEGKWVEVKKAVPQDAMGPAPPRGGGKGKGGKGGGGGGKPAFGGDMYGAPPPVYGAYGQPPPQYGYNPYGAYPPPQQFQQPQLSALPPPGKGGAYSGYSPY
mmetsp:Transcript_31665/g.67272  ORF Transcript_31665/g.67272 Transcript_31665/m.67272 type:complete len:287 (-) Transcript_31665:104-964(-)